MSAEQLEEIEKEAGIAQKFLDQLPERAFHLGLRVVLAGLAFLIGVQLISLLRKLLKNALGRSHVDEAAIHFIDSFVKFGLYFVLILTIADIKAFSGRRLHQRRFGQ